MVTTGSQKIAVWGPGGTPLGILRAKKFDFNLRALYIIKYWNYKLKRDSSGAESVILLSTPVSGNTCPKEKAFPLHFFQRQILAPEHCITFNFMNRIIPNINVFFRSPSISPKKICRLSRSGYNISIPNLFQHLSHNLRYFSKYLERCIQIR
jgi:hypothetical protein